MAGPLYKLWQARPTAVWYALSPDTQEALLAEVTEALDRVGGKRIVSCDAHWTTEQWPLFGVEEFPDLEALQQHSAIRAELNWARYCDSTTSVGTAVVPPQPPQGVKGHCNRTSQEAT